MMKKFSIIRKGQVTIPKEIRDRLGVKEGEKVIFVVRGDEVILKVVKGTILDRKGSIRPATHPEDFDKVRRSVKQTVATRVARNCDAAVRTRSPPHLSSVAS